MATPPQLLQMAFAAGLDESQQEEVLDPTKGFPVLENVRQDRRGGLSKRPGFGSLALTRSGSTARSAGRRLFAHKGVPTVIDGTHIDSYVEAATTNVTRSRVPECSYRVVDGPTPSAEAVVYDVEYCNGFVAVAYGAAFAGASSMAVLDADTGAVVRSPETIGSGDGVVYVASFSDRYFVAFVYVTSAASITAYLFDTTSPSTGWASLATVAASGVTALPSVCSLSNRVAVAYGTGAGTNRLAVATYNAAGVVETTTIGTSSVTPAFVSLNGSIAGTLWCSWDEATLVKVIGLDADVLATPLATTATALTTFVDTDGHGICEGSTAGTARVWALDDATPTEMLMCNITTVAGVATAAADVSVWNVGPRSRPFLQGDRYYMACSGQSDNAQAMLIVADWTDDVTYLRPVANVDPGLTPSVVASCKFSPVSTTGRWLHGYQAIKSGKVDVTSLVLGSATTSTSLLELDFATRDRWTPVDHANSTFLGGALTSVYDGERVTEAGFLVRPTKVATSSGLTGITGTYRYVAVYEDVDAAGNRVVSGISDVSDAIVVVDKTISLSTRTLSVSSRLSKGTVRVVWYRTATGGEAPYYRLGTTDIDTTLAAATFADDVTDTTLTAQGKLYAPTLPGTAGESLDRRAPPGLVHLESYAGMLVGAKGESIYFSGQEVYGEATWFSPVFEVPITGGGDITGLKAQDGALLIFKEDRIFILSGDAPSDNGLQGGLGAPRLIATDVGCIDPNSVVATSLGVFFQSSRGIELLSRAQTVEPIGEPLSDTLASYPIVTSAVLDTRNGLVRISLAASDVAGVATGNGRTVIFDLTLKAWVSVDSVLNGDAVSINAQSAAQVYYDSAWRYAFLNTDGTVYYERDSDDASAHLDGSVWVTMVAETAWIKLGGIQGHHHMNKVLLLARKSTRADLNTYLSYDYATTTKTVMTRVANDIDTLSTAIDRIQVEHQMHDEARGQAIKVKFSDATPTGGTVGTGKGATWIALTFEGVPEQGATGVPEAGM